MIAQFDNLFGGKTPQLSEVVHNFVNKEPKQFLEDFKPEIIKQVNIKGIASRDRGGLLVVVWLGRSVCFAPTFRCSRWKVAPR
jgi:hypothetical protein